MESFCWVREYVWNTQGNVEVVVAVVVVVVVLVVLVVEGEV